MSMAMFAVLWMSSSGLALHHKVRQLAWLERAQILVRPQEVRAVRARHFQCTHVAQRAGKHPHFPMRADPVRLAVRANRSIASVGDDVGEALRLHAEVIIRERSHPAPPQMRHQLAPRSPTLQLGILPNVANLEKILLIPWSGATDRECRRINGVRLPEEFRHIAIERHVRRGVLKSRLAVHEHGDFVQQIAGALSSDTQMLLSRNFSNPLALLAVWLKVLLERDDSIGGESIDFVFSDLVTCQFVPEGPAAVQQR